MNSMYIIYIFGISLHICRQCGIGIVGQMIHNYHIEMHSQGFLSLLQLFIHFVTMYSHICFHVKFMTKKKEQKGMSMVSKYDDVVYNILIEVAKPIKWVSIQNKWLHSNKLIENTTVPFRILYQSSHVRRHIIVTIHY